MNDSGNDGMDLPLSACCVCGAAGKRRFMTARGIGESREKTHELVQCLECGLVSLDPRPEKSEIAGYYSGDDPERAQRKPAFYERLYFWAFRRIPLKRKGALLDVGCGSGRYIYTMRQLGWKVKGVDITPSEYGRTHLGLDIHEGDLSTAGFLENSFDAVTFWWTLEHAHSPIALLKEALRILRPGGTVVVGVPNIFSREARIFKRYWFHLFLPRHVQHFTKASLRRALEVSGFKDIKIRDDIFSFGTVGSVQNLLNENGAKVSLKNPFFYALSLPLDMALAFGGGGGLMTAYAIKE